MGRIKSLSVSRISLLTSEHEPAVQKAGLGFSILKFFTRGKSVTKETAKLDAIIAKLSATAGEPKPELSSRLDSVIAKMSKIANDIETIEKADKTVEANI